MTDQRRSPPGTLMIYWDYDGQIGGERSLSGTQHAGVLGYRGTARIMDLLDERRLKRRPRTVKRRFFPVNA